MSKSPESDVDRELAEEVFENVKKLLRNDPQGYQTFLYYLDAKQYLSPNQIIFLQLFLVTSTAVLRH